jgi:hypothetical protein
MNTSTYPLVLRAPTSPAAMPCFALSALDTEAASGSGRRPVWDDRCRRILERICREGDRRPNDDVARLIEAETGMRFSASVLSRHRAALGFARPRRNEWTSSLRRWRPWQGQLAGKS